jgi:hypothetical protein
VVEGGGHFDEWIRGGEIGVGRRGLAFGSV